MQLIAMAETLDREDLFIGDILDRSFAREHSLAADEHTAGTTARLATAELRAGQLQISAEHIQQRHCGSDVTVRCWPLTESVNFAPIETL